jgi:predicted P-loop ATPase
MVRILADPWGSDAHITIGDKDSVLAIKRAWALELGELASLRKADVDHLKQFITQPVDHIRVPYGRLTESFPRQCVFIGTTNSGEYLRDTTGNRRFWPIKVEQCEFVALTRDRDQLMAEARVAWALGESLYLDDEAIADTAGAEQSARVFVDEWVGALREFLSKPVEGFPLRFTTHDLFHGFGPFGEWKETRAEQMRAAEALAVLGYAKTRAMVNGARAYFWELK